ncbi:alpha/beta hydrolase [Planotetraspora thailandica]|uniref:Alpha/beta hydrolase n=1 Tax=Planotetraspora thailandica TaxID=487172 RepID=A0A8J3Y1M0_9ACTN|nr:alpha/beta fold hydrolase [Planotetraspora thailandica]GII59212.1 alpha/beta hydrolase [Planotetraspora thailandica]
MRIHVDGVSLEVQDSGEGPAVLLVHGFPDTHALWRAQVHALNAAGYRTIAPDQRGYGASDRPQEVADYGMEEQIRDLTGILGVLGVPEVHLVGHDTGAAIAIAFAAFLPERVVSLTSLSVGHASAFAAAGLPQREKSWYMLAFHFPGLAEEWLSRDDFAALRDWTRHPEADEVVARLSDPAALTSALGFYRANITPESLLLPANTLPQLKVPTMGVWSSGDRFLIEEQVTGTERHVTGPWRYERLEGAGHWMTLEAPEEVNALLLDFLGSVRR